MESLNTLMEVVIRFIFYIRDLIWIQKLDKGEEYSNLKMGVNMK